MASSSKRQPALNDHHDLPAYLHVLNRIVVRLDFDVDARRPIHFVTLLGNNLRDRSDLDDPVMHEVRA
jgi:hypothetical protein